MRAVDFEAIKQTTDLVAVVERSGVALKKAGKEYVGLCPFHNEKTPSFHVNPVKGVFHCFGCGAAGNAVQFVAKREGLTVREAALKLTRSIPGIMPGSELPSGPVPQTGSATGCNVALLGAIVNHYHQTLLGKNHRGYDYLKKRGLGDVEMLRQFQIGYCDGSLSRKLSKAQRQAAAALGLLNEKENEKYYNRVVVPILADGIVVGLYGRAIGDEAAVPHLYLSGEHRGVWNSAAAAAYPDELIVTESILDALAIWTSGKKQNVIAAYGVSGWTSHHQTLIEKHRVKKIVIAYDNDKAGNEAAAALARVLSEKGVATHRLHWPHGVKDAVDYFQYSRALDFQGNANTFAALLSAAPRIGQTRSAANTKLILSEQNQDSVLFQNGILNYRVKGLAAGGLRVVLTAKKEDTHHIDNLDLYGSKARKAFAGACAERLGVESAKVESDLLLLVDQLEKLQKEMAQPAASGCSVTLLTEEEQHEALQLLRSPRLLDQIASDLELVGYVGEPRNKKLAYLIGTSRRLAKPLSGIFRAQSGCGKSYLMECVADLMPPEEVHYFSRLTPQALYYLEPDALTHKLLIVDERDGSEEAEYPIRTLQTRKKLKLAAPIKDPNSGRIKTVVLEINGPIAYMESTTDESINPENANRCFELYLDESAQQTEAIFAAQRRARTLEGWKTERQKEKVLRTHHNAQRLLRSVKVIIPFVDLIEFPAAWLRGRRDNDRFLSLIEGIAFLHQYQRTGEADYIEATIDDYAVAYDLAHQVFAQGQGEMPKPVADFYEEVRRIIGQKAKQQRVPVGDYAFSRRLIREETKMPDYIVKRYMRQIEELEYVEVMRAPRGGSFVYRLAPSTNESKQLSGLITPAALREKWDKWNKVGQRRVVPVR